MTEIKVRKEEERMTRGCVTRGACQLNVSHKCVLFFLNNNGQNNNKIRRVSIDE